MVAGLLAALRSHRGQQAALQGLPAWWRQIPLAAATDAAGGGSAAASTSGSNVAAGLPANGQQQRAFAHHAHREDRYRTAPKNYIQLLQHIARAQHLKKIDDLLKDYGDKFDALHVAAALTAVPRLLGPAVRRGGGLTPDEAKRPRAILERLQAMAALHADRLRAREISNVIWALGRCHKLLGARDPSSDARAVADRLLEELEARGHAKLRRGGSAVDAAQLLHGMARLRLRRPATLRALESVLTDTSRPANVRELALSAWGFGRLRWHSEELMGAIADRVVAEYLYLRPWSAAALMRTYTMAGYQHPALAAAVAEIAIDQARDAKPQELGVLAWALSRQDAITGADDAATADKAAALRAALTRSSLSQLESFGPVDLGLLLEGLERLGGADPMLLAAVAEGIAKETEVVAGPADAARIFGAFASASRRAAAEAAACSSSSGSSAAALGIDAAVMDAMVERLAAAATRCTAAFTPPQAEAVATAAARLPLPGLSAVGAASSGGSAAAAADAAAGGPSTGVRALQRLFRALGHHAAARPELYTLPRLAELLRRFAAADVVHDRLTDAAGERLRQECEELRRRHAEGAAGGSAGTAAGAEEGGDGSSDGGFSAAAAAPDAGPASDLSSPIALAGQLSALRRLRPPAAAALAAAAAQRVGDLRPGAYARLLSALTGRGELLADEAVRSAVVAAADDAEQRLSAASSSDAGLGGPARAAAVAAAFGRAVQHGLLANRGPPLVERLLEAVAAAAASEGGQALLQAGAARDVLLAMEAAGVEGPQGLRAAAEGALARAAAAAAGPGILNLMEAWQEEGAR